MQKKDVEYINKEIVKLCNNAKYKLNYKNYYLNFVNSEFVQQVSADAFLNYIKNEVVQKEVDNINRNINKLCELSSDYALLFNMQNVEIDLEIATSMENTMLKYIYDGLNNDSALKKHIYKCVSGGVLC